MDEYPGNNAVTPSERLFSHYKKKEMLIFLGVPA